MTNDHIRDMTNQQWQKAVAAEAKGRALETGDQDLIHISHQRALAAGCVDSDLGPVADQD